MLRKRLVGIICIAVLLAFLVSIAGCQGKKKFESLSYLTPDGWVAVEKRSEGTKILEIGLADSANPKEPSLEQALEVRFGGKAPETEKAERRFFSETYNSEVRQVFVEQYQASGSVTLAGEEGTRYSMVKGIRIYRPPDSDNLISEVTQNYHVIFLPKKKLIIKSPANIQDQSGLREFLDSLSF